MTVKELIELLQQQDPDKEVMIQQGEEYDYMKVYQVRTRKVVNMDSIEDEVLKVVVIEYQ